MEEIFYRYNPWWEESIKLDGVTPRPEESRVLQDHLSSKHIIFVTGLRRVGKTTLLKLLIQHLIKHEKIQPSRIFYISLDDYILSKYSILELIEEYRKMHKIPFKEKIFLFLDEVTHHKDYEQKLKNLYDTHNVKIYASSSSASVMKSKKEYLTGRHTTVEVMPLDFHEYLQFRNISISKQDAHLLESYFEEYLRTGGIPEYVLSGDIEYLKELVDDIIYKDIAALHNIKQPQILKDFFILLMERSGKVMSVNKIAHILDIATDTAKRYLSLFAGTYLIYLTPRCGKTNERLLAPKKIYAADTGIRCLFTGFRDKGSLFENYIYLRIKNTNPCYVYQKGIELDFFTEKKVLIEAKYGSSMSEKQTELFDKFLAKKKIIIKGAKDLSLLGEI